MKKALWAVRSSKKGSPYPNNTIDFVSSINRDEAKSEWLEKHPGHIIWTFDFVQYC